MRLLLTQFILRFTPHLSDCVEKVHPLIRELSLKLPFFLEWEYRQEWQRMVY